MFNAKTTLAILTEKIGEKRANAAFLQLKPEDIRGTPVYFQDQIEAVIKAQCSEEELATFKNAEEKNQADLVAFKEEVLLNSKLLNPKNQ